MRLMLRPPDGRVRLIVDSDTHNEIDDQFALAWALLSPEKLDIEGVVAAPYSFAYQRPGLLALYDLLQENESAPVPPHLEEYQEWVRNLLANNRAASDVSFTEPDDGMELSYREILTIFDKVGVSPDGRVFRGSTGYLQSLDQPIRSEGVDFIIDRAMMNEDRPLYVAAIGCLTNIASAILLEPRIIERMVVTWTSSYPSCQNLNHRPSFNLVQDRLAAQLLFDCGVPLVYLPGFHVGAQLLISLPEMERWVRGRGRIGEYLYHLYTHNPIHRQRAITDHFGRSWVIWDLINFAWLLNSDWTPSQLQRAPILTDDLYWRHDPARHLIREAYDVNRDAIFRDFFRKLALHASD